MSTARPSPTQSTPSRDALRRATFAGLLLLALALLIVAGRLIDTSGSEAQPTISGDVIESVAPGANDEVLRQTRIAIDLVPSWEVTSLQVNGVAIPPEQWRITPELALYEFVPAEGLAVESLLADRNEVVATIASLADSTDTRVVRWTFTAA